MNLDLITNNAKIINNINLFNNGKISWIVLGYSSNCIINIIETGENNFDDMFEEFDANKIMYGFMSVIDQNSKLKKNVFIFWQGKAAPESMKSVSVKHANIISNLCKPVHVTLNARDDQDLDMDDIMKKVALSSGANYSCHPETKKVYEHQASVKSEGNTAASMRQNRLKELSSLGSFHREVEPEARIGSRYEKIDPMKEIKKLRDSVSESISQDEPMKNCPRIDATKEIKTALQSLNRDEIPYKSIGSSHKRIIPTEELRSLNTNQKILFENKVVIKGENNTAEKAKEDRAKELSTIFNKKISCDDTIDSKVGTNYTKINPVEEIKKLKRESMTKENDDVFCTNINTNYKKVNPREEIMKLRSESITSDEDLSSPAITYRKIDPMAEIQRLRKSSSIESDENHSLEPQYRKVNPAEEIKQLRSSVSVKNDVQIRDHFEKINAMEEINQARRVSMERNSYSPDAGSNNNVQSSVRPAVMLSARKSFEMTHKGNNDSLTQRNRFSKQGAIQERDEAVNYASNNIESPVNSNSNNLPNIDRTSTNLSGSTSDKQNVPKNNNYIGGALDSESSKTVKRISDNINSQEITALALFKYEANEIDELEFEENEIITNIETIDEGWWVGTNNAGKRGMFPSNYVNLIDGELEKTNTSNSQLDNSVRNQSFSDNSISVRAIYDFSANDNQEVTFKKGDIISDVTMDDDNWWEGTVLDGTRGMFPANYVERI